MDGSPEMTPSGRPHWQEIFIVLLVVAGLILTTFFGFRFYRSVFSLRHNRLHPGATDVAMIQNWMTIPYIARAYRIPEETIWNDLGISSQGNRIKNLTLLDRDYYAGKPGTALNRVKAIVSAYLAQHPPVTPTPINSQTPRP